MSVSNEVRERLLARAREEEAAKKAAKKGGAKPAPAQTPPAPKKARAATPAPSQAPPVEPPAVVEPPAPPARVVGELDNPFDGAPPAPPVETPAPKKARAKKVAPPAPPAPPASAVASIAATVEQAARAALPPTVAGRPKRGAWFAHGEGEDRQWINLSRVIHVSRARVESQGVTVYHTVNLHLYSYPVEDENGDAVEDAFELPACGEDEAAALFDAVWQAVEPHGWLRLGDADGERLINPEHIQGVELSAHAGSKATKKNPALPAEWIAHLILAHGAEEERNHTIALKYLSAEARERALAALGEALGWPPSID